MRKQEHDDHCKAIAERLEQACNGMLYRDESGNEWEYYDEDEDGTLIVCTYEYTHDGKELVKMPVSAYSEDGETWTRGDTGEAIELEQLSLYDAVGDVYDIEYRVSNRYDDPRSVRLMIAFGGPNIYLDTATGDVELYWWGESGRYPMAGQVLEELDALACMLYTC